MKNIFNIKSIIILIMGLVVLSSCEDEPPTDYIQSKYLEGYLIVDEPIQGIRLMNSQPVNKKFDFDNAYIKDADVKLFFDGTMHTLIFKDGDNSGYYLQDQSIRVTPETKYEIIINTVDGKILTAETTTPKRIEGWINEPKEVIHYPQDTLKLPRIDSLDISWKPVQGVNFYFIRTLCNDTLDYGRYVNPPTEESNRRAYNVISNQEETGNWFRNKTNWSLIANSQTPTVWMAFKWFGLHDVSVYNPDPNMLNWFLNVFFTGSSETNSLLNSVKGGSGVFGSASVINKKVFLFKNQK